MQAFLNFDLGCFLRQVAVFVASGVVEKSVGMGRQQTLGACFLHPLKNHIPGPHHPLLLDLQCIAVGTGGAGCKSIECRAGGGLNLAL